MKRRFQAEGSPSHILPEKIPSIRAESFPAEMAADSSNDLGERLMNLPIELKQMIICSLAPIDRCQLRAVNKAVLDAVDASMCDVQEMEISFYLSGDFQVNMETLNPFNSDNNDYFYETVPSSSLAFLLKWAGARLITLEIRIDAKDHMRNDSHLRGLYGVFDALNSENACPKLVKLSLDMSRVVWDNNERLFSDLLKYASKRQLQAMATDHPTRFLHSLRLVESKPLPTKISRVVRLLREKRHKFLQDLLDQCHGLKELDVDSLLQWKGLPIVALRYPTTLTYLKTLRFRKTPRHLSTIIDNCPNLQKVRVDVGFQRDNGKVHALASLSDLRELTLDGYSMEEEMAGITLQCLAAFEDHPFGASTARPWPQLKSVKVNCYKDENYNIRPHFLLLSGANCCITSISLSGWPCENKSFYMQSVQQLFKALNSEDACPNLMDLDINWCELDKRIKDSLATAKDREPQELERWMKSFAHSLPICTPPVYDILNHLLVYVTKRQSAVRLGKPFLHSLSIGIGGCNCDFWDYERVNDNIDKLRDQLEQIHTTVQKIFDQCHGLEELYMESLEHEWINPNKKRGRELMVLVPLRFPTTLKKLNGVGLDITLRN